MLTLSMPGFMLTLRMLDSHSHTVCYALDANVQQAVGFRSPALEVVSQLWACLVRACLVRSEVL